MRVSVFAALLSVTCATACGASFPEPVQPMSDAVSAQKSAEAVGVTVNPQAQLHLKLAEEQIARAKVLIANGDNERAGYVLARAKGDADLALALARATNAKGEEQQAVEKANSLRALNNETIYNANPGVAR